METGFAGCRSIGQTCAKLTSLGSLRIQNSWQKALDEFAAVGEDARRATQQRRRGGGNGRGVNLSGAQNLISNVAIGAGFPLLFGQGGGAALGGAAGGGLGERFLAAQAALLARLWARRSVSSSTT